MSLTPSDVEQEALSLSRRDKARLVLHLLDSMDERPGFASPDIERAWIAEANRRYQAYLRGEEKAIPAEQVFAELREDDL
jgi:putative addiction module component (TIGR02574 family)